MGTATIHLTPADLIGWGIALTTLAAVIGALAWDAIRTWTGRRR